MVNDIKFINNYFEEYKKIILEIENENIINFRNSLRLTTQNGGKLYFVGNGASASLSSHASTDFTKQAKIEAHSFNDHNLITALSNDYGYENWVSKAIEMYVKKTDQVIFISVSGNSPNLVNAMKFSNKVGIKTASLTGCDPNNFLRLNSNNSIWVNSKAYNIVESIHTTLLTLVIDLFIGKSIYSVS